MKSPLRVIRVTCVAAGLASLATFGPAIGSGYDLNHYILGCGDACSRITPVKARSIDPTFTGSWYDPAQSGQGLSIEILPDSQIFVIWFTFNPDGTQQSWLVGNGTYADNVATIPSVIMPLGGLWIPNFDPRQVVNTVWGSLKLTFADANHGNVEFTSSAGYGTGTMNLLRLTRPDGITATALLSSGNSWVRTENLLTPRVGHVTALLADGRVLVAGGWTLGNVKLDSAEIYDPATGSWASTGNMTRPRGGHTATALADGKVLIVGGDGANQPAPTLGFLGTAELYDPATGRWTSTGSLNTPRAAFTATLLGTGKVLIAGGVDNTDDSLTSAELYDPASGAWSFTGKLGHPRLIHTASMLADGKVLVTGGWDDDFVQTTTATAELYDPVAGTWSNTASFRGSRVLHTATVLANGNVLIAGGYNSAPPGGSGVYVPTSFGDAQVYDTMAGNWRDVGSLSAPRQGHTATLLPDGRVLVAGGGEWPSLRNEAELFDPVTETWSSAGELGEARGGHTATLLQDGNVLFVGGTRDFILVDEEIYANVPIAPGASMTGAWYDPAQSGHGLVVEALPHGQILVEWFAFNSAGTQQAWFLGLGTISGNTATITSVLQPTGGRFIPNFDPSRIVNNAWGTLTVTFTDCDHGNVDFASIAGYGTGSMSLTRLTRPAGVVCP